MPPKLGVIHNSKTSGSKVFFYDQWPSWIYVNFQSCPKVPFEQHAVFILGPDMNPICLGSLLNTYNCKMD